MTMSPFPSSFGDADRITRMERILCRFDRAWWEGKRPRLEAFVAETFKGEKASDPRLIAELIQIDMEYRCKAGETVSVEDYLSRFPLLSDCDDLVGELKATLEEQERGQRQDRQQTPGEGPIGLYSEVGPGPSNRGEEGRHVIWSAAGAGEVSVTVRLGRGAFGTVYEAFDTELGRPVALKVPHVPASRDGEGAERFLREAKSLSKLSHPQIVTLYEVGRQEDLCYLVSEYIDGEPLSDSLSRQRPTSREAAMLVGEVAEALAYAHSKCVIHRDIKPSNLIIDRNGRPHLTDFGLARDLDEQSCLTRTGDVFGTPAYMSPEQARGERTAVDERSDVYSLGVVLYELLTGEVPFLGSSRTLLLQLLYEEPEPPRRLNGNVPRDLETICLKAIQKIPAERYQSAAKFAADLERFLDGKSIRVRPASLGRKVWRWCRCKPVIGGSIAALVLLLLMVQVVVSQHWQREVALRAPVQSQLREISRQREVKDITAVSKMLGDVSRLISDPDMSSRKLAEVNERIAMLSARGWKVLSRDGPRTRRSNGRWRMRIS